MGNERLLPGLEKLWSLTTGDPAIRVAVLDGAVDAGHPCFQGTALKGLPGPGSADGATDHGTHVASVILGRHGSETPGIAPGCTGLLVPIYSAHEPSCSQRDLARAINTALDHKAHVINVSGGQLSDHGRADPYLVEAVRRCAKRNALLVSAVGNDGCECLHVPAAIPSALAVGAVDAAGRPLDFSNWGEAVQVQGVVAPGEGILGAVPGGGSAPRSGTSFASPLVAGVAALLLARQLQLGQKPDPHGVREAILKGAAPCDLEAPEQCRRMLAGRFDPVRALALIEGGEAAETAPQAFHPVRRRTPSGARAAGLPFIPTNRKDATMSEAIVPAEAAQAAEATPSEARSELATSQALAPSEAEVIRPSAEAAPAAVAPATYEPEAAAAPAPMAAPAAPAAVSPSSTCGCRGGLIQPSQTAEKQLIYALGELAYDFGTEARLDYFVQQMGGKDANPYDPLKMAEHMESSPDQSNAVIWTLNIDGNPVYAIRPDNEFAVLTYNQLVRFLVDQEEHGVERISVAGHISGEVRLFNGTVVPAISPVLRGMFNWSTDALVEAVVGEKADDAKSKGIKTFLERVYDEFRNLGASSEERSMNFAATNAFQLKEVFEDAIEEDMVLDTIEVETSPICRPDSDCWDVKLIFFDPKNRLERARKVYRYTVDVSDYLPVTVGKMRTFYKY